MDAKYAVYCRDNPCSGTDSPFKLTGINGRQMESGRGTLNDRASEALDPSSILDSCVLRLRRNTQDNNQQSYQNHALLVAL